jgi:putative ABC transport system permease protein
MKLYQLALCEVMRRKIRALYTASGIALAVALLIATIAVGSAGQKDLMLIIARYGHSLTIFPATSQETSLLSFGIGGGHYIPGDVIPQLQQVYEAAIRSGWQRMGKLLIGEGTLGGVDTLEPAVFAPRLYEETTLLGKRVVVAGIDPTAEYQARFWWEVDAGELLRDEQEVMVGKVFAAVTGSRGTIR